MVRKAGKLRLTMVKAKVPVLTGNRNGENVTFVFRYLIEEGKKSKFRLSSFSER